MKRPVFCFSVRSVEMILICMHFMHVVMQTALTDSALCLSLSKIILEIVPSSEQAQISFI